MSDTSLVIYDLAPHETIVLGNGQKVTRVPGGWIYGSMIENGTGGYDLTSTFVPRNNEFQMKTREEAVEFISRQLNLDVECSREKGDQVHYGAQELRDLMDFIYNSKPLNVDQEIKRSGWKT